ncbi:MAG: DNA modification methylase [Gemmatimonadota bacterium]|nr:DNA modification methylase [Gemmatimonadota bacterium]
MAEVSRRTTTRSVGPPAAPVRDRIVEFRRVRAGDLAPNPANWRRHPERQRRALRALLREVGYADALLARLAPGGTLVLFDGHLRQSLDPDQVVPVIVTDLTEAEAEKLLLTLDPLAGLAVADPAVLGDLLDRVETSSSAVRALLDDLARKARLPLRLGLTDPEDIPPLTRTPRARLGDVWELGEHRIACADATDSLAFVMQGSSADVLWTDPPYGVGYVGKTKKALRIANDDAEGLRSLVDRAFAATDVVLRPGAATYIAHPAGRLSVTFAEAFLDAGWELRQTLIWVKDQMVLGHGDYHYRHEPILYGRKPGTGRWGRGHDGWYGGNAETSIFEVPRPRASRDHPTAKPVALVRRCLQNSSTSGDLVLDPFLGSGSTLIAAEQDGRRCVGIELDPCYVDVAVARWEAFTGERARRRTK